MGRVGAYHTKVKAVTANVKNHRVGELYVEQIMMAENVKSMVIRTGTSNTIHN